MKIVHFAPFSPIRAGIYEAARDCAIADMLSGHEVYFCDTGVIPVGKDRQEPVVGAVDHRGAFKLVSDHPDAALKADVIVAHTGVPDIWIVRCQAPLVWIIHSRPLSAFRSEQNGSSWRSFQLIKELASWPRVKAMVHFWPEFAPYWRPFIPSEKHVALDYPPIDGERYSYCGPIHIPGSEWTAETATANIDESKRGEWNGLICDSWRDDVDIYEVANGAIEAAKRIPGLKWHFYAMQGDDSGTRETNPNYGRTKTCWNLLFDELRKLNALGEVASRLGRIDEAYRGMDFVLTPHKIVTRVIGESLSCGTPVAASVGCKVTPYVCFPDDPFSVAVTVQRLVSDLKANRDQVKLDCLRTAENFSLIKYSEKMNALYERILSK